MTPYDILAGPHWVRSRQQSAAINNQLLWWGAIMKLTMRAIEELTCPAGKKDRLVFDDTQAGLVVRVTAAGGKSYLCQYNLAGSKKRVPLGPCNGMSLATAREAAAQIMGEKAKGADPAAERKAAMAAAQLKAAKDALTLEVLVDDWRQFHLANMKPRYAAEAVRAIHNAFADYLHLPAAAIDRFIVVQVTDAMRRAGSDSMAARTIAYGKACYQWAVKRGSLMVNPFSSLPITPTEKRDRVLSDDELAAVWKSSDPVTTFGAITRFLILTGQRREEVAGMAWSEISPDLMTWTIPGDRAKNDAVHVVPLSTPSRALLEGRIRTDGLVFPGRGGVFNGWSACKERLDTASGVGGWRLHDLRRSLATGLQRLGVRLEVTEAVLNHVSGSRAGIVGVYQRHNWADEKRDALERWGELVINLAEGGERPGKVASLFTRSK